MTPFLIALAGVLQSQSIDVDQLIKALDSAVPQDKVYTADGQKKLKETAEVALKDHNFDNVGIDGIAKLADKGYLGMLNPLKKAVSPRLMALAKGNKPENARAAAFCASFFPDTDSNKPEVTEAWIHCLKHALSQPALPGLLKDDASGAAQIFSVVQEMDAKELGKAKVLPAFFPLLKAPMSESAAVSAVGLVDVALDPSSETPAKVREETRNLVKTAFDKYAVPAATGPNAARKIKYYKSVDEYLDGAFATGKLMGHAAPDLQFSWSNTGTLNKLSDLKGKVVVLDFWATWCGPCVRSFPNVSKIQERYKDFNVVILGVTSLQGYHMDRVAKKRIDTKDNPTLEYSLMPAFMKDQNMTWQVGFSTTGCFDANFGVRGIPHMAIVDAKGVVRYNVLRPYDDPEHEAEKIDALLKEAGLPAPEKPMEKGNWAH